MLLFAIPFPHPTHHKHIIEFVDHIPLKGSDADDEDCGDDPE